jgi:hypothetical protein
LAAAPQERVHVPVEREDLAEDLSRGDLRMDLSEVGRRAVYFFDGVVGRVGGGNPCGHA